ncbi:MAG: hypothetical protein R3B09_16735 [Nannocystaceae bacterium]
MTEPPRYWTQAFIDALAAAFNTHEKFQRAARSFSETLILRCLDTPDGDDCTATFTFEAGRCVRHAFQRERAPSSLRRAPFDKQAAMARSTAPYALWVRLDRGEMSVPQALISPEYNVEGSKLKIMRHVGVLTSMNAVVASLAKSY